MMTLLLLTLRSSSLHLKKQKQQLWMCCRLHCRPAVTVAASAAAP